MALDFNTLAKALIKIARGEVSRHPSTVVRSSSGRVAAAIAAVAAAAAPCDLPAGHTHTQCLVLAPLLLQLESSHDNVDDRTFFMTDTDMQVAACLPVCLSACCPLACLSSCPPLRASAGARP